MNPLLCLAAVERTCQLQDAQGQILALALRFKPLKLSKWFHLGSVLRIRPARKSHPDRNPSTPRHSNGFGVRIARISGQATGYRLPGYPGNRHGDLLFLACWLLRTNPIINFRNVSRSVLSGFPNPVFCGNHTPSATQVRCRANMAHISRSRPDSSISPPSIPNPEALSLCHSVTLSFSHSLSLTLPLSYSYNLQAAKLGRSDVCLEQLSFAQTLH